MKRYPELAKDVPSLASFSAHKKFADFAGYILYDDQGQEIFAFGKHDYKVFSTMIPHNKKRHLQIQQSKFQSMDL